MNKDKVTVNTVGVFGLLGIAFIVLKLCHVINWSWWLVLLPFYFWFAVAALLALIALAINGVKALKRK